jgi:hypothetical protein
MKALRSMKERLRNSLANMLFDRDRIPTVMICHPDSISSSGPVNAISSLTP